jgi:hypothetical protein
MDAFSQELAAAILSGRAGVSAVVTRHVCRAQLPHLFLAVLP